MNITKEESTGKKLFVGVGEIKILAFNPDVQNLHKVMGWDLKDDAKEIEYTKDDVTVKFKKDGEDQEIITNQVSVDVWYQEVKTGMKNKVRFTIVNAPRLNRDGTKTQYINQHGTTCWVDSEENLPEWFTSIKDKSGKLHKRTYRKAFIGEEFLMDFLAKWTCLNKWNLQNDLFLNNMNKFWVGDMKELNQLLTVFDEFTVMACFGVKTITTTDTDSGESSDKEFQSIFYRMFCPGKDMKHFRMYAKNNFEGLTTKTKYMYDLAKFVETVQDTENGFKDFYGSSLMEIHDYDPMENPINNPASVIEEDSFSDDAPY